jgi:hypothetical protein
LPAVLKINGVVVNRAARRVVLHQMTLSMDSPEILEFSQLVEPACCGDFSAGQSVSLVDTDYTFLGYIAKAIPQNVGSGSISIGYTCLGLRWQANLIFITAADGTGQMVWNLPVGPGYIPTRSGRSVGDILKEILDQHATQLSAIGIVGYTAGELAGLTVVPPEPFTAQGRLWDCMADLLTQWMPNHVLWSDGAGLIHVKDTSILPATTLTLDTDPITLESITKDHSECFTSVVLRGQADVQAAYLSLGEHTIKWDQLPADAASWTIANFYSPKGASDAGDILSMTSNSLTVKSDDAALTFAVNKLSDIGAFIWAYDPLATGIEFQEQVAATANTALTAGGSYVIDVDPVFNNSGYTRYQVRGNRTVQSLTWRKLDIVPDYVAAHLCAAFNHSFPWSPADGVAVQTQTPTGVVCYSSSGSPPFNEFPIQFEIVLPDGSDPGYIVLYQPAPLVYDSQTTLNTPGAAHAPGDVKVMVPYSRGAISVSSPSGGGFAGTAYTVDGVQRVYYRDYPTWDDRKNQPQMQELADQILRSLNDTVYEGSLTYHGKSGAWLTLGKSLNIARRGGTTGWESIAAAVRSVSLQWPASGGDIWRTVLNFSSRRRPFSGDRLYIHPAYGREGALGGLRGEGWNPFGLTTQGMMAVTQARQQQLQEQFTPSVDQGEDLGIGFAGPGRQGQTAASYNRMLDKLTGDYTPTQKEAQHAKRLKAEQDRAEEKRWEGGDEIAAGPRTQRAEREERRRWEGGEDIAADPRAEREKQKARNVEQRTREQEEHLSGRDRENDPESGSFEAGGMGGGGAMP